MKYAILILFFLSSCIVIKNRSGVDGYSAADKSLYRPYSPELKQDSCQMVEITAQQLRKQVDADKEALVVMWATWCGHCLLDMPFWTEEAKTKSIYFVCPDYELNDIRKIFAKEHFQKPVYIISSSVYGTDEVEKTRKFQQELSGIQTDSFVVFPRHFYFKNGAFAGNVDGRLSSHMVDSLFAGK